MNTYTRMLICLIAIAILAAPSCAAPTPFVIGGWIFYENGTACNYPEVNITNLYTGVEWHANTTAGSNYYQITCINGTDLNETEQLRFSAKSPDGSQSSITEHTVTQGEVDAGGFEHNITLESPSSDTVVSIGSAEGSVGDSVNVSINITDAPSICAMDIKVAYNASILDATNVMNGSMIESLPAPLVAYHIGYVDVNISFVTYPEAINGDGELFIVTFDVIGGNAGDSSPLNIEAEAHTADLSPVALETEDGVVTVIGGAPDPAPYLVTYTISNTTISPDGDEIMDDTEIDVEFSESVDAAIRIENASGVVKSLYISSSVTNPDPKVWDGTDVDDNIVADGIYHVNITMNDGVNPLEYNNTETITVSTSPDTTPPAVIGNSPTGIDVSVSTVITITFNETMNTTSAEDAFSIMPGVAGAFSWAGDTMTFDPDALEYATTYEVTTGTEAEDLAGNALADPFTWNFTTATVMPTSTTVSIEDVTVSLGESVVVPVMVNNVANMSGCAINTTYNASVVHVTDVTQGDLMDYFECNINNGSGWMYANAINASESGLSGNVVFAYVNLTAVGSKGDTSPLDITVDQLFDVTYNPITHTVIDGTFTIEADTEPPLVTDASASRNEILNDNGRARALGTNVTVLNVTVIDEESDVASVTINLSSIGGSPVQPMEPIPETNIWTVTTNATDGVNLTHQLTINATDGEGNYDNTVAIELTVLRRGDVCRDNVIDGNDVMYIARYLAGLEPECSSPPSVLVGDVVGISGAPEGDGIVDLMDAVYIARCEAGLDGKP